MVPVSVAFRLGWYCGCCIAASAVLDFRGCRYVAVTANVVRERSRTPHLWHEHGRSLYDAMRPEFTLLRFDPALDVVALEAAARNRGVPLKILDIEPPCTAIFYGGFYGGGLVLSRPDQHVAWRGDKLPADPLGLIDRIRGAANQEVARAKDRPTRRT
jgi:hypothetical protein